MRKVDEYIEKVSEELCGAMRYAEHYSIFKNTNPAWAKMYAEMASQELTHANHLITMCDETLNNAAWVPEADLDTWDCCRAKAAEKEAVVSLILSK